MKYISQHFDFKSKMSLWRPWVLDWVCRAEKKRLVVSPVEGGQWAHEQKEVQEVPGSSARCTKYRKVVWFLGARNHRNGYCVINFVEFCIILLSPAIFLDTFSQIWRDMLSYFQLCFDGILFQSFAGVRVFSMESLLLSRLVFVWTTCHTLKMFEIHSQNGSRFSMNGFKI